MMELEKGDMIGLQAIRGQFQCSSNMNCVFNGKFVRKI